MKPLNKPKNASKNTSRTLCITFAVLLALTMSMNACSDNPVQPKGQIDGNVIKISAADLYTTNIFNKIRHKLAAKDGCDIITALKKKATSLKGYQLVSVAVKSLSDAPYRLHVKDDDGQIEKFVLALQVWGASSSGQSGKQVAAGMAACNTNVAADNDTYLALDPDFFYIHDTENGGDNLPITFPAASLTNSNQAIKITITKNASGEYMYDFHLGGGQPNLVYLVAVPFDG